MDNSLFYELRDISTKNVDEKQPVRDQHSQQRKRSMNKGILL